MQARPEYDVADEAGLRALFPPTHEIAVRKAMDGLDRHARAFVARAPFLVIGTQSADGTADVSPRGDPPGFVRVLDDRTLAIPDRPGNNRLDTLSNLVANPSVALIFMVPGYEETLRVNGRARVTTDPELLSGLEHEGRRPRVAILVAVEEAFLHCAKAFRRSRLWDPAARQDRAEMPSLMGMLREQTGDAPEDGAELERLDAALESAYRDSMY